MAAKKKRAKKSASRKGRGGKIKSPAAVIEGVQQIWLAGIGAIAKVPSEGPAAFQDAVTEGIKLLNKSRTSAEVLIRDTLNSAQDTMQSRLDDVQGQASETWDNLETLFQTRVKKALEQLGIPDKHEIHDLMDRVAELNDSVRELTGTKTRKKAKKKARAKTKTKAKAKKKAKTKTRAKTKAKAKQKARAKTKVKAKAKKARR